MYTPTQTQSLRAYESVSKTTQSGRETEAAVLTKAAVKLKESREDHELPKKLRLDILRLAAFIDRRIFETMAFPSPEKLKIVIDINNNLAAGLRSSP